MESHVLGGYTFKSAWPHLLSPFTYWHSDLQIRSTVPSSHPKEHPFLSAFFSSEHRLQTPFTARTCSPHLYSLLWSPRDAARAARQPSTAVGRSVTSTKWLLIRQAGETRACGSTIYHRNQQLCNERGGGRGEGILPGLKDAPAQAKPTVLEAQVKLIICNGWISKEIIF